MTSGWRIVIIEARLPENAVLRLDPEVLPAGWNDPDDSAATAAIGEAWLASAASLALRVPSAVLPLEWNLLVDPRHPRFAEAVLGEPREFSFDPRLAR